MTLYGASDPQVVGQPISPFFGAQNGLKYAGAPVIPSPNVSVNSGVQQPVLDAVSRGSVPHNALVNTVAGVSVGGVAAIGGDPCTVMELISSGNGNQANGGVGQQPINAQQSEQQVYGVGESALVSTENGPTPINVDTLGLAPVPAGIPTNQIALVASGFGG